MGVDCTRCWLDILLLEVVVVMVLDGVIGRR